MSFKRRIENQYQNLIYSVKTIELPSWINSAAIKISLSAFVLVLGFLYLLQMSSVATSGYEIHKLEKQIDALSTDIQKLEINVASESSMPSIQKRLTGVNMVAVENIHYINGSGAAMAKR